MAWGSRLAQVCPSEPTIPVEYHLRRGVPAEEIMRLARESHCDLIVMGTHHRSNWGRLLLGSVAEAVVRQALCPVLTIKAPVVESRHHASAALSRSCPCLVRTNLRGCDWYERTSKI